MDLIQRIVHALTLLHPPHTLFVHFPIALTGAALFFILVALWKNGKILEQVAFADLSLGSSKYNCLPRFSVSAIISCSIKGVPPIMWQK